MDKETFSHGFRYFITLICLWSISGSLLYYLYNLSWFSVLLSATIALLGNYKIGKYFNWHREKKAKEKINLRDRLWFLAFLSTWVSSVIFLFISATDKAIITPWQVINPWFFVFFFLTVLFSIKISYNSQYHRYRRLTNHLLYGLCFSIAAVVYKINYGFDPFIHQAAEAFISDHGEILPKTFYYIGQYSLVVSWHKLFGLSIPFLDKWLVPFLSALILPPIIESASKKAFGDKTGIRLLINALLILPFGIFILTTPQNLGFLLALIAILTSFGTENKDDKFIALLTAVAAVCCQPIAGIPALAFALSFAVKGTRLKIKEAVYGASIAINLFALPTLFYFAGGAETSWGKIIENFSAVLKDKPDALIPTTQNWLLNFVYLYGFNTVIIFIILIISGAIFVWLNRRTARIENYIICLAHSTALFISFLITKSLDFSNLISYEQDNYANRLLIMACLTALPLTMIVLYELLKRAVELKKAWRLGLTVFLAALITANLYLSYPRQDNYYNSRGFSTSSSDLAAVHWINEDAHGVDYIVLANQQTSTAALREFGFAKYYQGDIFYYPIPTGGELYQIFLMMNIQANRSVIEQTMQHTGTKKLYFVVNKYWWASDKIIADHSLLADREYKTKDGQVTIFVYELKSSSTNVNKSSK